MRFIIKTAFWLGLIAFFLPSGSPDDPSTQGIDLFGAMVGAQQAVSDLGGFCDRSPAACEAGGEVAAFVGARIGDGLAFAYDAVRATMMDETSGAPTALAAFAPVTAAPERHVAAATAGPAPYRRPQPAAAAATDPMETAAVAAEAVRRAAGLPPFGMPGLKDPAAEAASRRVPAIVVPVATQLPSLPVPTPAPRA